MRAIALILYLLVAANPITANQSAGQLRKLGDDLYYANKLNDAINAYDQLIAVEPSQINYFQRASTHIKLREFDSALIDLTHAIDSDKQFIKGYISRIKIHKITGRCDAALDDVNAVLAINSKHKQALIEKDKVNQCIQLVQRAEQQTQRQQYTAAKQTLTELLSIAVDSESLTLKRCEINLKLRDYDSVLLDTRTLLQHNKANLQALLIRGQAFYGLGEHDNALNHFKEALKQDPEHADSKTQFKQLKHLMKLMTDGDTAAEQNRHNDAIEAYMHAVSVRPDHTVITKDIYAKLAQQYIHAKQGQQALDAINRAIEIDHENNAYMRIRAETHLLMEQYQSAINDYSSCLQRDQTARDCQQGLQTAQTLLKRSTEIDYYKELDLPRSADTAAIKKQYRKMAMMYHPDKQSDATDAEKTTNEEKFKRIADAYDVLSNSDLRERYDRGEDVKAGPQQPQQQQQHQQHFHHGFPGGFGQQQQTFNFRFN